MAASRVKRERKPPKRFLVEFSSHRSQVEVKRKVGKPDKTLYEIDIIDIDEAQTKVKIHFKGYGLNEKAFHWCRQYNLVFCIEIP